MEIQRESRLCIGRKDSIKTQTPGERKIEMTAHSFLVSHWCLYRHLAWHLWLYHSVCMSFVHCQAVDPGGRTCVLITFEPQPLLNVELGSTQKELLNEWEKKVKSRRWKWFSSSSFFFFISSCRKVALLLLKLLRLWEHSPLLSSITESTVSWKEAGESKQDSGRLQACIAGQGGGG